MRYIFFACLLFIMPLGLSAQSKPAKEITLTGSLTVLSGETFPYRLVVTTEGNTVNGYSITYLEPNETKASIKGMLDRRNRTLSFKETDIIYSHEVHTNAFMCLIDAALTYKQTTESVLLYGSITSNESDNTACTGGVVTFSNKAEIDRLFGNGDKFDTVISMKKRSVDAATAKKADAVADEPAPLVTDKVTAGVEKVYEWHSDTVVIDVWDGGHIDGDIITLQYNGKDYLKRYFLEKNKYRLRIPLSGQGVDVITIIADNEGTEPPNTANIMLTDGKKEYNILAYNTKGQQATIRIKKGIGMEIK